jgi:hypothetical protein
MVNRKKILNDIIIAFDDIDSFAKLIIGQNLRRRTQSVYLMKKRIINGEYIFKDCDLILINEFLLKAQNKNKYQKINFDAMVEDIKKSYSDSISE